MDTYYFPPNELMMHATNCNFTPIEDMTSPGIFLFWWLWHEKNEQRVGQLIREVNLCRKYAPCSNALCKIWPHIGALFSLEILPKSNINVYNEHKNLPCSVLGSISKTTSNRHLKLGHFFNFVKFSLFYCLKLLKSMPFDERNGLG